MGGELVKLNVYDMVLVFTVFKSPIQHYVPNLALYVVDSPI